MPRGSKQFRRKVSLLLSLLLVLLCFVALLRAAATARADPSMQSGVAPQDIWTVVEDGDNHQVMYQCTLPDMDPMVLSIGLYRSGVAIYLEDELLFRRADMEDAYGNTRLWVTLPQDSAGKTLTMYAEHEGQWPGIYGKIYLGNPTASYFLFLLDNSYVLILGGGLVLLSLAMLTLYIMIHRSVHQVAVNVRSMVHLSLFMLLTGIWVVFDSQLLQPSRHSALIHLLAYLALYAMPVPFLLFWEEMLPRRSGLPFWLAMVFGVNEIVFVVIYLIAPNTAMSLLWVLHLMVLAATLLMLWRCVREVRHTKQSELRVALAGFYVLAVTVPCTLVTYYWYSSINYAMVFSLGLVVFIMVLANATFRRLYRMIERSVQAATYRRLAYFDPMTGIANRTAFTQAQKDCGGEGPLKICVVVDVNGLKQVNDTYGHPAGDRLLCDVAHCLKAAFGTVGQCYRIGGDEFAVLLDTEHEPELPDLLQTMQQELEKINKGRAFPATVACGYSVQRDRDTSCDTVFRQADDRMYAQKQQMKRAQEPAPKDASETVDGMPVP